MFNRKSKDAGNRRNSGKLDVFIRFEGHEGTDIPRYTPGERMRGAINIEAYQQLNVNAITVELHWTTQGKGDRDSDTVDFDTIEVSELVPGDPLSHPFAFTAPRLPWSYQGELIRVVWSLDVKVDVKNALDLFGMMDVRHSEPFILRP